MEQGVRSDTRYEVFVGVEESSEMWHVALLSSHQMWEPAWRIGVMWSFQAANTWLWSDQSQIVLFWSESWSFYELLLKCDELESDIFLNDKTITLHGLHIIQIVNLPVKIVVYILQRHFIVDGRLLIDLNLMINIRELITTGHPKKLIFFSFTKNLLNALLVICFKLFLLTRIFHQIFWHFNWCYDEDDNDIIF